MIREKKKHIRKELSIKIQAMPRAQRNLEEKDLCAALSSLILDLGIQSVLAYRALDDEVDLSPLLSHLLDQGISLGFPKIRGQEMDFYSVLSLQEGWEIGPWGLQEPSAGTALKPEHPCLVLVPGRGFTREGLRLGRGGGFYDRFLSRHPALWTLGAAYSVQLCQALPQDPWDQTLDQVATSEIDPKVLADYFKQKP